MRLMQFLWTKSAPQYLCVTQVVVHVRVIITCTLLSITCTFFRHPDYPISAFYQVCIFYVLDPNDMYLQRPTYGIR